MVEQPKYLEMTLSQLKSYVESSESNIFLVVEFPEGDQKDGERIGSCEYPSGKRAVSL